MKYNKNFKIGVGLLVLVFVLDTVYSSRNGLLDFMNYGQFLSDEGISTLIENHQPFLMIFIIGYIVAVYLIVKNYNKK